MAVVVKSKEILWEWLSKYAHHDGMARRPVSQLNWFREPLNHKKNTSGTVHAKYAFEGLSACRDAASTTREFRLRTAAVKGLFEPANVAWALCPIAGYPSK